MARFESVLRERRKEQPNTEPQLQPKRRLSPRWGVTGLAAVAVAAAALVAVALPSGGRSTSVASAQAFLQQIPDTLQVPTGKVLHTTTEVYSRYGPKAELIAAGTGIPTERHLRESWQLFAQKNFVAQSYARLHDESGVLLQESVIRSGEMMRAIDSQTGSLLHEAGPEDPIVAAMGPVTTPGARAAAYEDALVRGTARVVERTATQLTLELTEILPEAIRSHQFGPDDWQVPYAGDLSPVSTIRVVSIREDGIITSSSLFVVTAAGDKVLIEAESSTAEILDEMPELPF